MLRDEERSLGAFLSHEPVSRPAPDLSDDRDKAITVATMDGTHLGVITLEQLAGLREALTNRQVLVGQMRKFVSQVGALHHQNLMGTS